MTRAQVEAILIRRVGGLFAACERDGTTATGANLDLNDPIGWAIRQCGGATAAPSLVTDADLTTVSDTDQLLDLAELRALESALQNYDAVDLRAGPRTESFDQLGKRLEALITRKRKQLAADYNFGAGRLDTGVISLSFAETGDV